MHVSASWTPACGKCTGPAPALFRTHFLKPVLKTTPALLTWASRSLGGSGKRFIRASGWW